MADVTYNPHFEDFFSDEKFYKILYGSAGCFDGNTLVNTSQGYRKIRDIEKGELVLSFNEKTKLPEYKKVLNTFRYYSEDIEQPIVTFYIPGTNIVCTANHKFYIAGEWVAAIEIYKKLIKNEQFEGKCYGNAYSLGTIDILGANISNIDQWVYDLEVEDNSNYCITTNDIIVHNSGKSYAIAQKLVLRCLNEEGHTCWAFRKVSTYIEQSVFATILQVVEDCGATSLVHINKTQRTIHFKNNGNKIICAGLDDEEKIKSILNVTIAWVEEATEFNEQDINQLDLRMRGESKVYRELILSFNPVSELHWIKRKFFDEVTPGIQSKLYTNHSTFRENYFLDRDYKERLIQNHSHDPNNYRVYVLGEWGKVVTGQEYYKNFHEDMHVRANEYDDSLPIHLTFDFNTAPYMSASVWQIEKVGEIYEVRGLDELVMKHPKNSTEDTCYEFLERWGDKCANGLLIYGDATGRARKTSSKKTDYMIIEQILGHLIVEMRVPRSNPLPQDKHTFMNRMMYGTFPIRMYVHPDMKFTLQDLTHVLEDQERKKVKARARDPVSKQVVEKFGHFSDAMDYFFMEAFKPFIV